MAIFLWTAINLMIMVIAALGCINPVYRRSDERFPIEIPVTLRTGGHSFSGVTSDISLTGCSIRLDLPVPSGDEPVDLHFEDIGKASGRWIRRGESKEMGLEFLDLPKATQTALFIRIFLNPDNHCQHLDGPEQLYADCFKRMFGNIE